MTVLAAAEAALASGVEGFDAPGTRHLQKEIQVEEDRLWVPLPAGLRGWGFAPSAQGRGSGPAHSPPLSCGGRRTPHAPLPAGCLARGGRGVALLQSRAWRESRSAMASHCTRRGASPVAPASPEVARHMAALDGDGTEAGPSVLWRLLSAWPVSLPSRLPGERHELTHAASVPPGERPGQGRPLSPRSGASEVGGRRASGVKAAHTPHRADRVPTSRSCLPDFLAGQPRPRVCWSGCLEHPECHVCLVASVR